MEIPIEEVDALKFEKAELALQLAKAELQNAQVNRDQMLRELIFKYGADINCDRIDFSRRVLIKPDIAPKEVPNGA